MAGDNDMLGYRLGHELLDEQLIAALKPRLTRQLFDNPQDWAMARFRALSPWRERIHKWAQHWADEKWPIESPAYLLEDAYPALLQQEPSRIDQLVEFLIDTGRARRLYENYRDDYVTLSQLRAAATKLASSGDPSFPHLGRIMAAYERLSARSNATPDYLLELLVLTGQLVRATRVALSVSEPEGRIRSLIYICDSCRRAGDQSAAAWLTDLARKNVADVPEQKRAETLVRIEKAKELFAPKHDAESTEKIAGQMWHGVSRDSFQAVTSRIALETKTSLTALFSTPVVPDDPGNLEAIARLESQGRRGSARSLTWQTWVSARSYQYSKEQLAALAAKSRVLGMFSNPESDLRDLVDSYGKSQAWPACVEAVLNLVSVGETSAAEALARQLLRLAQTVATTSNVESLAHACLAALVVGDLDAATTAVNAAFVPLSEHVRVGSRLGSDYDRAEVWEEVLFALASSGETQLALALVPALLEGRSLTSGYLAVARGVDVISEALLEELDSATEPYKVAEVLGALADRASTSEDFDLLQTLALELPGEAKAAALAALAISAATQARLQLVSRQLAQQAAQQADGLTSEPSRQRALAKAATALLAVGETEPAGRVIERLTHPLSKVKTWAQAGRARGEIGDTTSAKQFAEKARSIMSNLQLPMDRSEACTAIAAALASAGFADDALDTLEEAADPILRLRGLEDIAGCLPSDKPRVVLRLVAMAGAVPASPASLSSVPRSLLTIATRLAQMGYESPANGLVVKALEYVNRLSRPVDQARVLSSVAAVQAMQSIPECKATLAYAWTIAGCPWVGWRTLVAIDKNAIRTLGHELAFRRLD
jgi:hypothetical protein